MYIYILFLVMHFFFFYFFERRKKEKCQGIYMHKKNIVYFGNYYS